MKNNVPIFFLVFLLAAAALVSYGVFKPLLSYAVIEDGRGGGPGGGGGPAVPDLSAASYSVNTNGADTDTLTVAGGAPNTTAVLYYTGPNGASGSEAMCTGDTSGSCRRTYGPWYPSAAGGWDFYVVMNVQKSNTIHIDFVAPRSAQLSVSPINFSLAQGSVESGSAIVQNVSSVSGSSFTLAYSNDAWIVVDSAPSSLGAGANGTLNFHVDNSKVPARGGASQTITGGIAVSADGSGSGTAVTGSPQTITVSYTIPPSSPVISAPPTSNVVINRISDKYTVSGGRPEYLWYVDDVSTRITGSAFQYTFTSLGNHTIKVTDANGNSASVGVTVTNPPTCQISATWDTKTTFCVGDTTTYTISSNPPNFSTVAHNISNRPNTHNPYDPAVQVDEPPYFAGVSNGVPIHYTYNSNDVGFFSQQKLSIMQGGQWGSDGSSYTGGSNICTTEGSWNNITIYPSNDPHCGGGSGGNPPPASGYPKLSISPSSLAVSPNDHATFSAYYLNQDAKGNLTSTDVTNAANWSSSNAGVASPTLIRGDFIANSPGSTNVTAGYAGLTGSSALTVGSGGAGLNLKYSCVNNACVSDPQGKYGSASSCAAAGCGGGGTGGGTGGSNGGAGGATGGPGVPRGSTACSPAKQSAFIGQGLNFSASGGNGVYVWAATGGNPVKGSGTYFNTSYNSSGSKTVTATSAGSSASCSVDVSSVPLLSCTFTANPRTILPPQKSVLSWNCSGATYCEISGVGPVNPVNGSVNVGPTRNTSYVLSCNGSSGQSFTLPAQVNVSAPVICEPNVYSANCPTSTSP